MTTLEKEILLTIKGNNSEQVKLVFVDLRKNCRIGFLPELIPVYVSHQNNEIKSIIFSFFCDIKNQEFVPFIIDAIINPGYEQYLKDFLTVCWNSSLDFSAYSKLFIDIFVKTDFETSFEIISVIENMADFIEDNVKNECIADIQNAMSGFDEQKKLMAENLIEVIKS